MKLEIEKVVNLSTAHITERDNHHLAECTKDDHPELTYSQAGWVISTGYGFMVFVPPKGNGEEVAEHVHGFKQVGMSKEFIALFKLAAEQGCTWLRLDCDIPTVEGLQVFDW